MKDIPFPEDQTEVNYDFFVQRVINDPNILAEASFVALSNGQYIGKSISAFRQNTGHFYTTFTGVKEEHRRTNVALALKLCGIAFAKAHGHKIIKTMNESGNQPILSLNKRLGFVKKNPARISFVKVLKEE